MLLSSMALQVCTEKLEQLKELFKLGGTFMLTICVLNLIFSFVATFANLLVIHALWKASSIPTNLRKLFLSLAFSDLAVGLIVQPMYGIIIAVMSRMAASGSYNFNFCPTPLAVMIFSSSNLTCASFLNVFAIAVDRFLVVFLHLRYQELVTSRRIYIALTIIWITSGVAASIILTVPKHTNMVAAVIELAGLLFTTAVYFRIYKVVKYHRNEIQRQLEQPNTQAMDLLQEKKSAFNVLFVYAVYLTCYLPHLLCLMLMITIDERFSFLVAQQVSILLIFFNSSLNPIVYCWRYREIRAIVKNTLKKMLCKNDAETQNEE